LFVGDCRSAAAAETSGAVIVLHDITELRKLERVRAISSPKGSNELRTPAYAIQGSAETLLEAAIDDSQNRSAS